MLDTTDYTPDAQKEAEILLGMALDKTVLGRIAPVWDGDAFMTPAFNTLGGWCVAHYRRHHEPPRRGLRTYLDENDGRWDRATVGLFHSVFEALDARHQDMEQNSEAINSGRLIDLMGARFRRNRLKKLTDGIDQAVDVDLEKAEGLVARYGKLELGIGAGARVYEDDGRMPAVYEKEVRESLVPYRGALGRFWAGQLRRGNLIGIMAVEKGGKSLVLLDIAYRAAMNRRRVAYFQAGDLTEEQILDRFYVRGYCWPSESTRDDGGWPCHADYPTSIRLPDSEDDPATVEWRRKEFDRPLYEIPDWNKKLKECIAERKRSTKTHLMLSTHPTKTLSVAGMRSILDSWELDGFVPDIVIVDYSDILLASDRYQKPIDQIKQTWEELRRLNTERHVLMVTATQVNAASYTKRRLDRSNFAGNHLKHAEVSGMVGLHTTPEEKDLGICRLNWVFRRNGAYSVKRQCHLAGCWPIYNITVQSAYEGERESTVERNGAAD